MTKKGSIPLPSADAVNMVLRAADSAPRPNGQASRQLDAATAEVTRYFQALFQPADKA